MKKVCFIIISLMLLVSCKEDTYDHDYNYFFVVSNDCDEQIDVSVTYPSDVIQSFQISPGSKQTFHYEACIEPSNIEKIDQMFKIIEVRKGDVFSKKDYTNHEYWEKVEIKEGIDNYWNRWIRVDYYLHIRSEDF
ncbi:MAG: hypothetical protein J6X26_02210 [Bacteroidales bacterium]|nr:hypothetical protein [Bacteroidales bacterium]